MTDVDVCVVGAGFAGLTAALGLKQAGHSVTLLEARGRIQWAGTKTSAQMCGWIDGDMGVADGLAAFCACGGCCAASAKPTEGPTRGPVMRAWAIDAVRA